MDRFAVLAHGEVACDARSIQVRPIGTLMCRLIHVRCMSATPAARWPLITPRAAGLTSHSLSPFPLYRCSHLCRHQPRRLQHGGCSRLRLQMAWPRLRRLASLMLALGLAAFATSLAACSMVAAAASACKWLGLASAARSCLPRSSPLSPSASPPAVWWRPPLPPASGLTSHSPRHFDAVGSDRHHSSAGSWDGATASKCWNCTALAAMIT